MWLLVNEKNDVSDGPNRGRNHKFLFGGLSCDTNIFIKTISLSLSHTHIYTHTHFFYYTLTYIHTLFNLISYIYTHTQQKKKKKKRLIFSIKIMFDSNLS